MDIVSIRLNTLINEESLLNDLNRAIPLFKSSSSSEDEDNSQYRLIVPSGTENEIPQKELIKAET